MSILAWNTCNFITVCKQIIVISDSDTNCNWCTRHSNQRIGPGTCRLGYKRTSGNHSNYSIIRLARILRRVVFWCHSDSREKPSAEVCIRKTLKNKIIIGFGFVSFGLVLWHINHCRLFNAKYIFIDKTVLFQTIQFSISTQLQCQLSWMIL